MISNELVSYLNIFIIPFDGEETETETETETENNNETKETKTETKETKTETKAGDKKFTQEELNKFLAEDRRKNQKNRDDLLKQLNDIKENATLTKKQKEDLEGRIEQLQNETLSAQELAKKDREKIQKEYEKKESALIKDRDYWKNTYQTEKVERELLDAAIANKALNPKQLVSILRPDSKLVEVLKDGKPTGAWETRVTLHDKGEDGSAIVLELPATETVKRMSEMEQHYNLFNSGVNGGFGGFNNSGGSVSLRGTKPPKDHAQYIKWRAANIKGTNENSTRSK